MALKEQVANVYSVGLQNVGSYMVSGQPFIARRSVNAGGQVKIEFPYVTKNIKIRIPSPPNTAVGFLGNNGATQRMWTDGALTSYGNTASDFTFSHWMKAPAIVHNKQPLRLTGVGAPSVRYQWRNTDAIRFTFVNSSTSVSTGNVVLPGTPTDWHHYLMTQITGNVHIYIDNQLVITRAKTDLDPMNDVNLPPNMSAGNLRPALHDELSFWTSGMTADQVGELYNSRDWYSPMEHSLGSNLEAWWTMGDFPGDSITGAGLIINDAALPDQDFTLFSGFDAYKSFDAGPFAITPTGKLRVHMLSTGSASGANIYANKHYRELTGYNTSISLPMKTKEIYLTGVDAQVTFEVIAELTNVPTERMYALTGSGIDE